MSSRLFRRRRIGTLIVTVVVIAAGIMIRSEAQKQPTTSATSQAVQASGSAADALAKIPIKGRAPMTGYARTQFGDGWTTTNGCDTRDAILRRDLKNTVVSDECKVMSGTLSDPYTTKSIAFTRGAESSSAVQIDHVVPLGDSWQTGAQQFTKQKRIAMANDPMELLAVDGPTNQAKGDGDAATWLPPNKSFRCQYVARQIAVKAKYGLWMTQAEHDAINAILSTCPGQSLPME